MLRQRAALRGEKGAVGPTRVESGRINTLEVTTALFSRALQDAFEDIASAVLNGGLASLSPRNRASPESQTSPRDKLSPVAKLLASLGSCLAATLGQGGGPPLGQLGYLTTGLEHCFPLNMSRPVLPQQ